MELMNLYVQFGVKYLETDCKAKANFTNWAPVSNDPFSVYSFVQYRF
jgi:hypothetical protein